MNGTVIDIQRGTGSLGRDLQIILFDDNTVEDYTVGTFYAAKNVRIGDRVKREHIGWQTMIALDMAATYGPLSAKKW